MFVLPWHWFCIHKIRRQRSQVCESAVCQAPELCAAGRRSPHPSVESPHLAATAEDISTCKMGQTLILPLLTCVLMLSGKEVCNIKLALPAAAAAAAASAAAAVHTHIDDGGCMHFLHELCDVFRIPGLRATDKIWHYFVVVQSSVIVILVRISVFPTHSFLHLLVVGI